MQAGGGRGRRLRVGRRHERRGTDQREQRDVKQGTNHWTLRKEEDEMMPHADRATMQSDRRRYRPMDCAFKGTER